MPLWERDLVMEEAYEHYFYGLASRGLYASKYLVDRCMIGMDTHWVHSIPLSVQSCDKNHIHPWFLYDAFIIQGMTWELYLSHLDGTSDIDVSHSYGV